MNIATQLGMPDTVAVCTLYHIGDLLPSFHLCNKAQHPPLAQFKPTRDQHHAKLSPLKHMMPKNRLPLLIHRLTLTATIKGQRQQAN